MEAVGYELFCKMLNQAVAHLKGETIEEDFETTVDLDIDGYIPESYIEDEFEKLNMYKKISAIRDEQDLDDIRAELEDRFSEIPQVTQNLLNIAYIKSRAHECFVTEIENAKQTGRKGFKITLLRTAPVDTYKMLDIVRRNAAEMRFVADKDPFFVFTPAEQTGDVVSIKTQLIRFFDIISEMLEKPETQILQTIGQPAVQEKGGTNAE